MVKNDSSSKKEREKKKRAEARNPNKFKDFKKVKQKVGAKKRGPANQTSGAVKIKRESQTPTFRFAALNALLCALACAWMLRALQQRADIDMKDQALRVEKSVVSTSRNLTLTDLLAQTHHHNHHTRRGQSVCRCGVL